MDDGDDDEKKKGPTKLTEQQLVESGAFVRELDERIRLDRLDEKVDVQLSVASRHGERIDKLEEKFETKLDRLVDGVRENTAEMEKAILDLRMLTVRQEAQIQVLMDAKDVTWASRALELLQNKQVRAALFIVGGWLASQMGPEVLKRFVALLVEK